MYQIRFMQTIWKAMSLIISGRYSQVLFFSAASFGSLAFTVKMSGPGTSFVCVHHLFLSVSGLLLLPELLLYTQLG